MMKQLLLNSVYAALTLFSVSSVGCAQPDTVAKPELTLTWLEGQSPTTSAGTTWGAPWPVGSVAADSDFALQTSAGEAVPMQSWPLAYWPDGSLKWSGHALQAAPGQADAYSITPGASASPQLKLSVLDSDGEIVIDTGSMQCVIPRQGSTLVESIMRDGSVTARAGHLVCVRQDQAEAEVGTALELESFVSEITKVTLEQSGPVRAVVKIEGTHANAGRAWLPFVVRLYFYAGGDSMRIVHSIVYDGDENVDFVRGLGMRFTVPMHGALHDRHVRFSGQEDGLWAEAVRGLTGLRRDPGAEVRAAQIDGRATPSTETWEPRVSKRLEMIPAFGDFTLFQPTADSFEIRKRTKKGLAWLNSAYGERSSGLGYIGSPEGGVAFGIRDFWQSHPSQLDIRNATEDEAEITLWLWSPEARPMDMRFYHDGMGLDTHKQQLTAMDVTYEDYEPGFATPMGVARTSELMLWALPATPDRETTVALAHTLATPPQLVCQPQDYKAAEVFGGAIWDLPDRSTPSKAVIEDQLDFYFDYYQTEVEQRHWYGFWNYGDVMHSYDDDRHVWRYDVGGFAWANSELSPDLWLWYSFLRSGRADIYRMAEAMTRHTGEVDVYHLGRFAGLGSRHNVMHWGDSAKQLRISTATNRRFLYYLTADERIGDLLQELLDGASRLVAVPPGRKVFKPDPDMADKPYSMKIEFGTSWTTMAAAWLTEWERTGNTHYRDLILNGMRSIGQFSHGWVSGRGGYDPQTGIFYPEGDDIQVSHLSVVFGGFEINAELIQLFDVPEYEAAWLLYCKLYNLSRQDQRAAIGKDLGALNLWQAHSRLTAYAAWKENDPALAARAWDEFFEARAGLPVLQEPYPIKHYSGPAVLNPIIEAPVSTNAVSQFGLAAIQNLALQGDKVPATISSEK